MVKKQKPEATQAETQASQSIKAGLAQLEKENHDNFVREYQALVQKYGLQVFPILTLEVRKAN